LNLQLYHPTKGTIVTGEEAIASSSPRSGQRNRQTTPKNKRKAACGGYGGNENGFGRSWKSEALESKIRAQFGAG
jgi:hypothetical protein